MEITGALLWNIEKIVSKGDYNYAIVKDHPNRTKDNYVLLHRVVAENKLGRLLNSNEIVHHIDEDKKNNDPSNLEVMTRRSHNELHAGQQPKTVVDFICPHCQCTFTVEKRNTRLVKSKSKQKLTFCSRSCSGSFYHYATTQQVENAISVNVLRVYNLKENTEGTHLHGTP